MSTLSNTKEFPTNSEDPGYLTDEEMMVFLKKEDSDDLISAVRNLARHSPTNYYIMVEEYILYRKAKRRKPVHIETIRNWIKQGKISGRSFFLRGQRKNRFIVAMTEKTRHKK